MQFSLPYGKGQMEVEIPDANVAAVATPPSAILPCDDESAEIRQAMANPIGSPRLRELAKGKRTAAILVSDYTRPTPSGKLVPPVVEELLAGGIPLEGISVVFAAGAHRPTSQEEMKAILGEQTYSSLRMVAHDCDAAEDLVYVGTTQTNKTEVWMNRAVVEADLRVSLACIEPHQGAGWSGGAKNILPGWTLWAKVGSASSMECLASSGRLARRCMYRPGVIRSVDMSSPNLKARPVLSLSNDYLLEAISHQLLAISPHPDPLPLGEGDLPATASAKANSQ